MYTSTTAVGIPVQLTVVVLIAVEATVSTSTAFNSRSPTMFLPVMLSEGVLLNGALPSKLLDFLLHVLVDSLHVLFRA